MPLQLAGTVFNSIVGAASNAATNRANLRINQMNNEFNAREAEKAFQRESAYNDKIRAEDRAYNSAMQQVERYRQAGLNPTIMMQGQSAGIAQSNGVGSSAAQAAAAAPQQSFTPNIDASGVNGAVLGFLNYRKEKELVEEQLNGLRIENQYKAQKIMAEIAELRSKKLTNDAKAKLDNTIESMQDNIMQNANRETEARVRQMNESAELMIAERLLKSKELDTFDERFKQETALRLAQTLNYSRAANLSLQQTRSEVYRTLYEQYKAQGQRDANRLAQRTTEDVIRSLQLDNDLKRRSYELMPYDKGGSIMNGLFNTVTQGIVGYGLLRGFKGHIPVKGFGR